MRLGLEGMQQLDAAYGFPSKKVPYIHVGGTNGKGSVTTKIATALYLVGYKVGLYTSPHISSFRERIRINETEISEEEAFSVLGSLPEHVSFFEAMTLLAFLHFAKEKCDVAVLEVGMGGRLDATNIVHPLLSVITTIEMDHSQYLGETLEKIAEEKGGIIKPGIPVVVGPKAKRFEIFRKKGSPYYEVEGEYESYEEENRAIARKALSLLPFKSDLRGLEKTPPCRFEIFEREIPIVLDVAHNLGGFRALFKRIQAKWPSKKVRAVIGLSKDKEVGEILTFLKEEVGHCHFVRSTNPRSCDPLELATLFSGMAHDTVKECFQSAKDLAFAHGEVLVVAGTFYIMSEVRKELGIKESVDPVLFSPY